GPRGDGGAWEASTGGGKAPGPQLSPSPPAQPGSLQRLNPPRSPHPTRHAAASYPPHRPRRPRARGREFGCPPPIPTGRNPPPIRFLTPTSTRARATCANAPLGSRRKIARAVRSSFPGCAAGGSRDPISVLNARSVPFAHVHEMPRDRGRGGHRRRHQGGATLVALAALEIAVRGRGAALAR